MSGGLLPVMAVLLLITLAVIIERAYFFHRVLTSGHAMEHDLQLVDYQNAEKLEKLAAHYDGSLQRSIISSALASRGQDADTMERRSEEHTSELQSRRELVCRLLLEKKKKHKN